MKKFITKRRIFCLAVVVAVVIVPLLYSYFYLGAFWDPYSKLDKLPVAVVNEDEGATINGTDRNLGEEMCDQLKEDASLKFVFTDAEDAKSGTEGDEYYATITIPENFSENIASASTEDKQTATITYAPNEKRNFLASQILNRAVLEIEEETRSTVDQEIVQQLADNIKEVPDQLTELQDGLNDMEDGSSKLLDGTGTLSDGTQSLLTGTKSLYTGTQSLYSGTQSLLTGTATLADGTNTLIDGTAALADGTSSYYSKFGEYKSGVDSLKSGSSSLATGAESLQSGISQVKSGTDQLVEKTNDIGQITTGASTLATGMKSFDENLTSYTTGVNSLISTVNSTSAFLAQYVQANPALMSDPTFAAFMAQLADPANATSIQTLQQASTQITAASSQLVQGTSSLSDGTKNLSAINDALKTLSSGEDQLVTGSANLTQGAKTLDSGVASLSTATDQLYAAAGSIADGASSVNSGAAQLNSGAAQLSSGAEDLNSGAAKLNSGAKDLNSGASDLDSGASDLNDGMSQLNDGITTAQTKVGDAVTDADDQITALDGLADYAATPVSVEQESVNAIPNYGTAFAPYFMSLSLWVGALILFVGIYLDTEGKFKIMSRDSEHKLLRSFLFLLVGFLQAIALAVVVKNGLGLEVDNVPLYYLSICLVSLVFISMVQFFIVHLKSAGKLISIVMLILQLTSCGGTFPMELVPKIFNNLFPYMPMTYSVALFKQVITKPDTDAVLYNCGVLGAILIVFMFLTVLFSAIKTKKAAKEQANMSVQFES